MSEVLVLRDEVGLAAVSIVAAAEGWKLREETSRAHLLLASRRWAAAGGTEVIYLADHPGGVQSLRITGSNTPALARRLKQWLPCHGEDELLAVVLAADEPDPVVLVRIASKLAVFRPERPESRHLVALDRLLSHRVDAVRRAGIRSAYGCRWKELRALVDERRADEQRLWLQLEELRKHLDGKPVVGP